jgi:hypothetical protein
MVKNLKKKTKSDKSYLGLFVVEEVLDNNKYLIRSQVDTFKAPANFFKRRTLQPNEPLYTYEFEQETSEEGVDDYKDRSFSVQEKTPQVSRSRSGRVRKNIDKLDF